MELKQTLSEDEQKLIRKLRRQARKRKAQQALICEDDRIKLLMAPLYAKVQVN